MKTLALILFIVTFTKVFSTDKNFTYAPTWESLESRPFPGWFDKVKIGLMIHWGVYSVPAFGSEWFWSNLKSNNSAYINFMKNYPKGFTYQDFAKEFKAELFSPDKWAELFVDSGIKYVVITAKHIDGYTLWPSSYSNNWNAKDVGPRKDLLGDFANAIKKRNIHFGLYYSLYEWFHPTYLSDKKKNFTTQEFVNNKLLPELKEVVEKYKPEIIWSNGHWEATDKYFQSKEFLAWLYNKSPVKETVIVNDSWGKGTRCHYGGYFTGTKKCNKDSLLQSRKFEISVKIYKNSYGYTKNTNIQDYVTPNELITTLVETVSCGGNIIINIGPTKEGTISPIFQERLLQLGAWLKINGEGIYNTVPWQVQKDKLANVWYTQSSNGDSIYAIMLEWPDNNILELGSVNNLFLNSVKVQLGTKTLQVNIINTPYATKTVWVLANKVKILVGNKGCGDTPWGWVLKITNFQ